MTGFVTSLTNLYREQLERHRNRPFLKAAMAACAVVAMSDGVVSFRQRVRIDQLMDTLDALQVFDPHEGVELFNGFVEEIRQSPRQGHEQAIAAIREEAAQEPDKAELLIRVCLAVSEVEGRIPLTEQIEIVGLCSLLGLDPNAFGLYTEVTPET